METADPHLVLPKNPTGAINMSTMSPDNQKLAKANSL